MKSMVDSLVAWFKQNRRELPWRKNRDPYAVWISEIMLQQTRIDTVIDYYARWMQRFPTVAALGRAPLDEVLALWAGLGYYARARNLHRSAQKIADEYDGKFPDELERLLALPGVGRYTAGAIASIAFQKPEPIVDGNVARVLQRVYAIEGASQDRRVQNELWQRAQELVPTDFPSEFNQGLMELGQLICTVADPSCERCPLVKICRARKQNRQSEIPAARAQKKIPVVKMATLLVQNSTSILLMRRKPAGLWGGLWEPPSLEIGKRESAATITAKISDTLGVRVEKKSLTTFEHVLTHRRMQFHVYGANAARMARPKNCFPHYDGAKWVAREELLEVGIAAWTKRLANLTRS